MNELTFFLLGISQLGKWSLIWGGIGLIAWLISTIISVQEKSATKKAIMNAKKMLVVGNWMSAAAIYKKEIIKQLDNPSMLRKLTFELAAIYRHQGIEPDLKQVLKASRLYRQIFNAKIPIKEKSRLFENLYKEIIELLDKYPGELDAA